MKEFWEVLLSHKKLIIAGVAIFLAGWLFSGIFRQSGNGKIQKSVSGGDGQKKTEQAQIWTCSMHPQIQLPKPGKCPICAMNLIPLERGNDDVSARTLVMSPGARKLAEIQTSIVERKFVPFEVRMVGKVDYDESRRAYIAAWASGRIDRLYVEETGTSVRKGDHMVYLYSPELLSAQEEYLQALKSVDDVKESHLEVIRTTSETTLKNAGEKLRLLGITEDQIQKLTERGVSDDHMTIYAPVTGIVIHIEVQEGDYVKTGARIYSLADLSTVWVKMDAYESDVQWLRYGQEVEFEVEAYPGRIFRGRISFIDPILHEKTRTVKVRINVANEDYKLKPGMFVRAVVRANVGESAQIVDSFLAEKWICPMHPAVVEDKPGACSVCGMPLVSSEELGLMSPEHVTPPLVIPASAVLKTGKRAVVYVGVEGAEKPTYEGREILLGARAGDYYIVESGLKEGQQVVTQGNFKIDSALQIQAKPSMMSPESAADSTTHEHEAQLRDSDDTGSQLKGVSDEFRILLEAVYDAYFAMQHGLANDNVSLARDALESVTQSLELVDMELLKGEAHMAWMNLSQRLKKLAEQGSAFDTAKQIRQGIFGELSEAMLTLQRQFGHRGEALHYEVFCPMAFDNTGASWLQNDREVMNPFFGKMMQKCGEVKREYPAR